MRRAIPGVVAFAVLFAIQAWLRPVGGGAHLHAAESSLSVLGGALKPLFVAITWAEAEAALEDHRFLEALDRLRLLEAAEPAQWEAAVFRAHVIAHNLAEREPSTAGKVARIAEAVAILDAAAARTSDPAPAVAKGQLMLEARMWDKGLAAQLEQKLKATPRATAVRAFEEALARAPGSEKIRRLSMESSRLLAFELLARDAPFEEALASFERADAIAREVRDDVLARRLAQASAGLFRAAVASDGDVIDAAADRYLAVLAEWKAAAPPSDDFEAVLAAVLARRAAALAEKRLRDGAPRAALSLVRLVHTIRSFVIARLDQSRATLIREALVPYLLVYLADRRRLVRLLDEISRKSPDLSPRISELRMLISAW